MHLNRGKLSLRAALVMGALLFAPMTAAAQDGFDFGAEDDSGSSEGMDFGSDDGGMDFGSDDSGGGMDFGSDDSGGGMDFGSDDSGGGMDFGSSTGSTAGPVDTTSTAYDNYTRAQQLIENKEYLQAAQILNDTIAVGDDASYALSSQLHYELGRALYESGYYQAALNHFDMVVSQGATSKEFDLSLPYLVLIGRELPGEPRRYSRIYDNYLNKFPTEVSDALISEVGYLLAMAAYRESKLDDVVFFVGNVAAESPYYAKSRYLEGVTYVRQNKGEAALDSFKEVLRWFDKKVSAGETLTSSEMRLREFAIAALGRVFYQVGSTLWDSLGEREKAVSSWNTAIKYYNYFSKDSQMWLDSLFEASWTYYRVENFGKALGLLLTLNSPFYNDKYYPEAMLLQATIYYTNCHYDRVVDILSDYKATYEPLKDQVDKLVSRLFQPEEVYDFLHMVQTADKNSYDPTLQQVLEAAVQDRELLRGLAYIDMLDEEKERIASSNIAGTSLGQSLVQEIDAARTLSIVEAGKKGKLRLERLQEELRDLSNRALDIEIETTEKYAAGTDIVEQDPAALAQFENEIDAVMDADDEHQFWTFDGEYWKDELGYYWYYISSRCER